VDVASADFRTRSEIYMDELVALAKQQLERVKVLCAQMG
jgi:hypothetical protein